MPIGARQARLARNARQVGWDGEQDARLARKVTVRDEFGITLTFRACPAFLARLAFILCQ